jgi:2-methylfumaryl-CoA hydratase
MMKNHPGNYFEDFRLGQVITHATPRTVTAGDVSLYTALYGSRFAVQSSDHFARAIGYSDAPVDDLLAFNIVFGKTVPDISLNAVANLGYSSGGFLAPVYPGDTLSARSKLSASTRTRIENRRLCPLDRVHAAGAAGLEYGRWVMVRKRDEGAPPPCKNVPSLPKLVAPGDIGAACPPVRGAAYDHALTGSAQRVGDYAPGERIDHVDGMTVEEAEHQLATRLYQNTARVHFDQCSQGKGRFGRRLIYGGHVISLARALSFNGLANAFHIAGINGGRHVAPLFAGDTVFAWSEVIERAELPDRTDIGALRLRLVAAEPALRGLSDKSGEDYDPDVIRPRLLGPDPRDALRSRCSRSAERRRDAGLTGAKISASPANPTWIIIGILSHPPHAGR